MRRSRHTTIQNEEVLPEVLKGETFFIPCANEKDAHSKCVSLNNAKVNNFPPWEQKKIRIQKVEINEQWGVKAFPATKIPILKLVDKKMVPWLSEGFEETIAIDTLSQEDKRIISLMITDKCSPEEILSVLSGKKEELVKAEIDLYTGTEI